MYGTVPFMRHDPSLGPLAPSPPPPFFVQPNALAITDSQAESYTSTSHATRPPHPVEIFLHFWLEVVDYVHFHEHQAGESGPFALGQRLKYGRSGIVGEGLIPMNASYSPLRNR